MNFDDILPFIVFVAYIGFAALRAVLKKKKKLQQEKQPVQPTEQLSEKPARKAGFGFSKIINNIKSELAKAVNEAKLKEKKARGTTQKNIWEELRGSNEEGSKEAMFTDRNLEVANKISVENSDAATLDRVEQSAEPIDDESQTIESQIHTQRPQTFALKKRKQNKGLHLSAAKMREAIILSEILAKPVGLRE